MDLDSRASSHNPAEAGVAACPVTTPLLGRIPGWLALATVPLGLYLNPLFCSLAGGLLAVISLLMSAPRARLLGLAGLVGSVVAGVIRLL